MSDTTINPPDFESLEIDPKTIAYSCLNIEAAELIGSIRWDAASILNWGMRSSAWFAHQILMRMGGEFEPLEIRGADLAQAFWPGIADGAGRERISSLIRKLNEDQYQSGFYMLYINTDRKEKRDDGSWFRLPTLYSPAEFPSLFHSIQMAAIACDLCKLPRKERRARQRSMISTWLFDRGCKIVEKVRGKKKEKSQKEKRDNSECENPCPHCALMKAAKGATASEADGARSAEERITRQTVELDIQVAMNILNQAGVRWLNLNLGLPDFVRKIHSNFETEELRLRDAVKRHNAPKLKLVGGQPK